ncbi:hypothetical protein EV702DRAFT_1191632 [Suillus placidus]|uniref:Uncharacterized protein n=1 Tax=Suillus placidus TaxID=48579 RepID=A0A9P7A7R2_9AGAM|nr:hypothetical protein EV702DRAFT_1191632 [Suillus placidus]
MSDPSQPDLTDFTILDATNLLEYATSRFAAIWIACDRSHVPQLPAYISSFVQRLQWEANTFVFPYTNICMVLNIHLTMPDLLRSIISRFARLQTGNTTGEQFFNEFFQYCSPHDPQLRSTHRVVTNYAHDWWKDRFDILGFALPSLNVNEVIDMAIDHFEQLPLGAMLLPGPVVADRFDGAPLLNQILAEKIKMAAEAASIMSQHEGPMDELEEALLNALRS